jgi:hypothetical protein
MKDMNASYQLRFFTEAIVQTHRIELNKFQPEDIPQILLNIPITRFNNLTKPDVQSPSSFARFQGSTFVFNDTMTNTSTDGGMAELGMNFQKKHMKNDSMFNLVNEVRGRQKWKGSNIILPPSTSKRNLEVIQDSAEQFLRVALNYHKDAKMWIKKLWNGLMKHSYSVRSLSYFLENIYESGGKARSSYEEVFKVSPNYIIGLKCYASLLHDIFRFVCLKHLLLYRNYYLVIYFVLGMKNQLLSSRHV